MQQEIRDPRVPSPPRMITVLCILIAAALIASYLWAYAVTDALIAVDLMTRWPPGHDPRPMRMCIGFISVMIVFTIIATIAQWISRRQLKHIDEMEDA